jgi:hypothetical protein
MAPRRRLAKPAFVVSLELGRYSAMVVMLLFFFFTIPFTSEGTLVNVILNLMVVATLLSAVQGAVRRRDVVLVATLLALVALVPVIGLVPAAGVAELAAHAAALSLVLLAVMAILSHVLTVERVTLDILIGAASVYLLIGLLWGALFALLEYWFPGSFNFPSNLLDGGPTALLPLRRDATILYYSFETLTTLGFGDVTPATAPSRFLSILEALVGQLYLAVLVGRFVALQLSHGRDPR